MGTPIYVNLSYRQYKEFERQFARGCSPLESSHNTMDERYYHKAIRFSLGELEFEVTGPMVMAPRGQGVMEAPGDDVIPGEKAARDAACTQREDSRS